MEARNQSARRVVTNGVRRSSRHTDVAWIMRQGVSLRFLGLPSGTTGIWCTSEPLYRTRDTELASCLEPMASFTLSHDNMSSVGLPIHDHLVCASLMYFSANEVMTQLAMRPSNCLQHPPCRLSGGFMKDLVYCSTGLTEGVYLKDRNKLTFSNLSANSPSSLVNHSTPLPTLCSSELST
jgi:hypothetical protein